MTLETAVHLGQLVKPVGLRGDVKLRQSDDFWEEALQSAHLVVVRGDERQTVRVTASRVHSPGMWVLRLDRVQDRAAAEQSVGADLWLEANATDVPDPEMLRPFQVRGMRAVLPDGRLLGEVVDVLQMPAQDLLVVRDGTREHLIPNVAPIVRRVDLQAGCVEVDPPPGLLDLEF